VSVCSGSDEITADKALPEQQRSTRKSIVC
jgi:hypothetical protein